MFDLSDTKRDNSKFIADYFCDRFIKLVIPCLNEGNKARMVSTLYGNIYKELLETGMMKVFVHENVNSQSIKQVFVELGGNENENLDIHCKSLVFLMFRVAEDGKYRQKIVPAKLLDFQIFNDMVGKICEDILIASKMEIREITLNVNDMSHLEADWVKQMDDVLNIPAGDAKRLVDFCRNAREARFRAANSVGKFIDDNFGDKYF